MTIPQFWPPALAVLLPLIAAGIALLPRARAAAGWIGIGVAGLSFALVCALPWWRQANPILLVDNAACLLAGLAGFTGLAAAWSARWSCVADPTRHLHPRLLAMLGCVLLALLANNLAVEWLALAAATLAASRSWMVLAAAGLALALFGLIVLHNTSAAVALDWSAVARSVGKNHGSALDFGFICLLLGYGGIVGLVPLHGGLLQAQTDEPAPLSCLLGSALTTAGLLPLLRLRAVVEANSAVAAPGRLLIGFGLLGLLLAAAALWRESDLRRGLIFAAIGQTGAAVFAFGLGGAGLRAGLLQLAMLALIEVVVFSCLAAPASRPRLLALAAGMLAIAGLPPFGLFASLFAIVTITLHASAVLALPLGVALAAIGWSLMRLLLAQPAEPPAPRQGTLTPVTPTMATLTLAPALLALAIVLLFGLGLSDGTADWFTAAAGVLR